MRIQELFSKFPKPQFFESKKAKKSRNLSIFNDFQQEKLHKFWKFWLFLTLISWIFQFWEQLLNTHTISYRVLLKYLWSSTYFFLNSQNVWVSLLMTRKQLILRFSYLCKNLEELHWYFHSIRELIIWAFKNHSQKWKKSMN